MVSFSKPFVTQRRIFTCASISLLKTYKEQVTLGPKYEAYCKINFRLVGKNKRVGIAPNHKLSRNKQIFFSLNTNPHAFSLRSVGVIADETGTLPSPLPPAVR